jgi:acetyl-CoA synthetase
MKPCAFAGSMPGMAADIVDAEGRSVPAGETGELVMRQPSIGLSRGLWNAPERYLETYWNKIPGLWVHGDWATRDADGFWFLHGRSDDTIMVAGKRCGPSEVESLLMATGKIAEAAATGVDDALKGESVLCVCVPKPGVGTSDGLAQELRDAVTRGLSPAFRPRAVLFVRELPKTRSLKVMRRVVRAIYEGRDPGNLASLVNPPAIEELRAKVAAQRTART